MQGAFILLLFLSAVSCVSYISPSGGDFYNNNCQQSSPCYSVHFALSQCYYDYCLIYAAPGYYNQPSFTISTNATVIGQGATEEVVFAVDTQNIPFATIYASFSMQNITIVQGSIDDCNGTCQINAPVFALIAANITYGYGNYSYTNYTVLDYLTTDFLTRSWDFRASLPTCPKVLHQSRLYPVLAIPLSL